MPKHKTIKKAGFMPAFLCLRRFRLVGGGIASLLLLRFPFAEPLA